MSTKHRDNLEQRLTDLGAAMQSPRPFVDNVMAEIGGQTIQRTPRYRTRKRMMRYSAVSVLCLLAAMTIWWMATTGGTGVAFAAVIDNVERARTFSYRWYHAKPNEEPVVTTVMFKEPDLYRIEEASGRVLLTDYGRNLDLDIDPALGIAVLRKNMPPSHTLSQTGEIVPEQLNTDMRDRLLLLKNRAVNRVGQARLGQRTVEVFRLEDPGVVYTLWVDSQSRRPVQIECRYLKHTKVYTDIRFDVELDDALFSFDPPQEYRLRVEDGNEQPQVSEARRKSRIKILHIMKFCNIYAANHDSQFPKALSDLTPQDHGLAENPPSLFKNPTRLDLKVGYIYCGSGINPATIEDPGTYPVLYEAYDRWPENGIAVGFVDGHVEVIADEQRFRSLLQNAQKADQ